MHCCDFALSGSDSRSFFPTNPSVFTGKSLTVNRSSVSFPKTVANPHNSVRLPFRSIRAKASTNDGIVSSDIANASFYEVLGIPESGSLMEIKQAYKQLARKYHPDVSPPGRLEENTKRFIRVQEAYETLSDPKRRALYDRDMARGLQVAFSARRRHNADEGVHEKSEWQSLWQDQLSELKRRSTNRDARHNMSWGARMRSQVDYKV